MPKKLEDYLQRVDNLIQLGSSIANAENPNSFHQFRTGSLSCLRQLYGESHPYFTDFNDRASSAYRPHDILTGVGILRAVKVELEGGWFASARALISAEIFADYLDMAKYLVDEGYKDASAVLAGSTLESHLRQLCLRAGIPVDYQMAGSPRPKKADLLNSELASGRVYDKLDQKSVTAWLDLRNKAAHGNYDDYTLDQVRLMVDGIRDFITRNQP